MPKSQKSYWLKSGLLTILERGSVFVFGFGGFYLLTRALSGHELGLWVIFYTITSFIEVGRSGLLQNALVKYLTNASDEEYPILNTASATINIGITIIFILLILLLAYPTGYYWFKEAIPLTNMLLFYCFTAVFMIPFHQFNFIQMANMDFKGIFWANFVKQGLFFFFILFVVLLSLEISLLTLVFVQAGTAFVGALINYFFSKKYLRFSKIIDRQKVKELFNFGRFVFGTNISTMVYKRIDTLMLGALLLPASAGIYEWAIKITNLSEVPTFSIANIVFPQAAKQAETGGRPALKILYEKSVGAILGLILPFILIVYFFADPIIMLLAGSDFTKTIPVLELTILFGIFIPYTVLFGIILDSMNKPKINFYFTIGGSILNIISNYIFITNYGLMGAAYGTFTSYAVTFILQQYVLNKILGTNPFTALYEIFGFYKQGINLVRNFLFKESISTESDV